MSESAVLADRGVVSVSGADARKLLGGLVTNEIALLDAIPDAGAPSIYAALLTPQGKILFDFFVVARETGCLLETDRARAPDLAKRLSLYKLRADVAIRDVSAEFAVIASWGEKAQPEGAAEGGVAFADPRLPALGWRKIVPANAASSILTKAVAEADYHAHRVRLGVPEGGRDFVFGDTFPHEALLDQLHGVSFTKGCFVGQEVVSRMQHRTVVRKRIVTVNADVPLPEGPLPVQIGKAEIGRLGSVAGRDGLALARIDRVAEAQRDGMAVTIADLPVQLAVPGYARFEIKVPNETA